MTFVVGNKNKLSSSYSSNGYKKALDAWTLCHVLRHWLPKRLLTKIMYELVLPSLTRVSGHNRIHRYQSFPSWVDFTDRCAYVSACIFNVFSYCRLKFFLRFFFTKFYFMRINKHYRTKHCFFAYPKQVHLKSEGSITRKTWE